MTKLKALIATLAEDAVPVMRFPAPRRLVSLWLFIAAAGIFLFVAGMGVRQDLVDNLRQARFVLELVAALATAIGAAWAATISALPGRPHWQKLIPFVPAVVWAGLLIHGTWLDAAPLRSDLICFPIIILLGTLPCVVLIFAMRRGVVLSPCLGMFFAVSASAALGYVGLRLVHPENAVSMILVWQFGPVVLLALFASCFGRRMFPHKVPDFLMRDMPFKRSAP